MAKSKQQTPKKNKKTPPKKRVNSKGKVKKAGVFSKYRTLSISIIVFLILNLSILSLNYYQSFQIEQSAHEIAIATRQGDLIQQITKNLVDINLLAERMQESEGRIEAGKLKSQVFKQYDQLQRASNLFNQSLNAFDVGGQTVDNEGELTDIERYSLSGSRYHIDNAVDIWTPFLGLINSFVEGYDNDKVQLENIQFASDYARIYNKRLLADMTDISTALQNKANTQSKLVRLLQIFGIAAALLIFLFIVLRVMSSLLQSDRELEKAKRETDDIMRTVKEGLFLVDSDYIIANEYSAELPNIIGEKDIGGKNLESLLAAITSEKDMETTRDFIEQLFNRRVVEDLVHDLNPLDRHKVYLADKNGVGVTSYLSFNFSRVYEGKEISRVLVSVSDITKSVELEERLEVEKKQHDAELELLSSILHIESKTLSDFISHAENSAEKINDILKQKTQTERGLREKVDKIFREAHSLKGEASALKLDNYVMIMQNFEEKLKDLRSSRHLTGNDFLAFTIDLEHMIQLNNKIQELNRHLRGAGQKVLSESISSVQEIGISPDFFSRFAQDIADRNGKEISVHCHGLSDDIVTPEQYSIVKDLTIQLLRNAIVHGIEKPEQREAKRKKELGSVNITLSRRGDSQMLLTVEDDGQGINFEMLRQKAVDVGMVRAEKAADLTRKDLLKVMLRPGISTIKEVNQDAGQGVGSDVIIERMRELKGKININTERDKFTRFQIVFPVQS